MTSGNSARRLRSRWPSAVMVGLAYTYAAALSAQNPAPRMTESELRSPPVNRPAALGARVDPPRRGEPTAHDVPEDFRFEQDWNRGPYCGPNSLYVLLRLMGQPRDLEEVKEGIPIDLQRGSSLQSLSERAAALGLENEIRSVAAEDLRSLPAPYIAHASHATATQGDLGHFLVVFDYEAAGDRLGVIDGTSGSYYYVPRATIARSFSGYVLVPADAATWIAARWVLRLFLAGAVATLGGIAVAAWLGPRGSASLLRLRDRTIRMGT